MRRSSKKVIGGLASFTALAVASWLPSVARANAAPAPTGFVLIALSPSLVASRAPGAPVRVELGVLVAGHGHSLEVRTRRPTYGNAWVSTLTIRSADGRRLRSLTLPRGTVTTSGLRQFGQVVVSSAGEPVASATVSWCPGRNLHQRVDGDGVADAIYPASCSLHPFALGRLNGLERGWGSAVATSLALPASLSWCVAPTDAIDLNVPGALWRPQSTSLASACGDIDAQWLRQVLPVGWGDTYVQTVAGQAIDITELPNGRYHIKVTVNPEGTLHERRTSNNVSYRLVILGGTPGNRTVQVPAHQGVNTG